ncbi:ABC transporter ATP-binding protein [Pseudoxanthomonas wuyuanensis]
MAHISVNALNLAVPIYVQPERKASNWSALFLGAAFDPPRREFVRLLTDISFEVAEGDRVALLGRNGAGKSTLLRVINGVYAPTSGRLKVEGSCQALLNMSLGFNSEATVRENILLRGTAMGITAKELRDHIEPILEFAGLQAKANHRLRTLSAGQKMRLGFSISTTFQHDIILMDEWVGAGDSEFMKKATERMKSRVGGSKIVMLASHSVGLLRDICNKGIVLDSGRIVFTGDIVSALRAYHDIMARPVDSERSIAEPVPPVEAVATAPGYGAIESITVSGGVVCATGWAVGLNGIPQQGIVIELSGTRYSPKRLERRERPDVASHLGLGESACGFFSVFEMPFVDDVAQMQGMQAFTGETTELARSPLRLASLVAAQIRGE